MQWHLLKLRKERGLTQEQLAKIMGISVSSYINKENSKTSFKDYEMFILAKFFGKGLEEIFLPTKCIDDAISESDLKENA